MAKQFKETFAVFVALILIVIVFGIAIYGSGLHWGVFEVRFQKVCILALLLIAVAIHLADLPKPFIGSNGSDDFAFIKLRLSVDQIMNTFRPTMVGPGGTGWFYRPVFIVYVSILNSIVQPNQFNVHFAVTLVTYEVTKNRARFDEVGGEQPRMHALILKPKTSTPGVAVNRSRVEMMNFNNSAIFSDKYEERSFH